MRNFKDDLAREKRDSRNPIWLRIYQDIFDNMIGCVRCDDIEEQKLGIDRIIMLNDESDITVDEKVRYSEYNDIAIERWSSIEDKIDGWAVKRLKCDYILYVFWNSGRYYLIPFKELRSYVLRNLSRLERDCYELRCRNKRRGGGYYTTVSILLPIDKLLKDIPNTIHGRIKP